MITINPFTGQLDDTSSDVQYGMTFFGGSHGPAAGGATWYFGQIFDLAALQNTTDREFRFPVAGNIVAASFMFVAGTAGTGTNTATLNLRNVTGSTSTPLISGISVSVARGQATAQNLLVPVNTTSNYAMEIVYPALTTGVAGIRITATLVIQS